MAKPDENYRDPREAKLVEDMVLDSMDYIHGKGREEIVKGMKNSGDTAGTLSAMAYKVVAGVAENNKDTALVEMDMDMMMGVTTEVIDMMVEVAQAAGEVPAGTNVDRLKEDTLLKTTVLHGEQLEGEDGFSPEQQQAAQTDLRDYMSDAGAQKAFSYVDKRAKAEGTNPNDMRRQGNEMAFGAKNPLAEGVKQGLMGGSPDGQPMPEPMPAPESQPMPAPESQPVPDPGGQPMPAPMPAQAAPVQGLMGGQPPQEGAY